MARKSAPLSFRIDDDLRAAIEAGAQRERRSVSSLVTLILSEWVKAQGVLVNTPTGEPQVAAPRRYKSILGRPRKVPDATNDWLDAQVSKRLDPEQDYSLADACLMVTGKPLTEGVANFDKSLVNALLRSGWVEAIDGFTNARVWITRERFDAPRL